MGCSSEERLLLFSEDFVRSPHTNLHDQRAQDRSVRSKQSFFAVAAGQ